jgi:hypothetical protein
MNNTVEIHTRQKVLVNLDPQKRCYNGAYANAKYEWGPWEHLETLNKEDIEQRLTFWKELNNYAVSCRGKAAIREFKTVILKGGCRDLLPG